MARINKNYDKLAAGYLFPEIARRTNAFLEENSGTQVLRLGIGDTTEPIVPAVLDGLHAGVDALGNAESYSGYGPSEGIGSLREGLSQLYKERGVNLDPSEFFVSDGAASYFLGLVSRSGIGCDHEIGFADQSFFGGTCLARRPD